jgi:hypothetical protein
LQQALGIGPCRRSRRACHVTKPPRPNRCRFN